MIIDHNHPEYVKARNRIGKNGLNGAFFYSLEIVKNIIPRVKTDRNWITLNVPQAGAADHSIVFIHDHVRCPEVYEWLANYNDLVLVCCIEEDARRLEHLGTPVILPLNVDVEYVKQFRRPKTRDAAFIGRTEKRIGCDLPDGIDFISFLSRKQFLMEVAKYRTVYAVDRSAIEARVLGCEVKPYGFLDCAPEEVIDNREAAVTLQKLLDEIDRKEV